MRTHNPKQKNEILTPLILHESEKTIERLCNITELDEDTVHEMSWMVDEENKDRIKQFHTYFNHLPIDIVILKHPDNRNNLVNTRFDFRNLFIALQEMKEDHQNLYVVVRRPDAKWKRDLTAREITIYASMQCRPHNLEKLKAHLNSHLWDESDTFNGKRICQFSVRGRNTGESFSKMLKDIPGMQAYLERPDILYEETPEDECGNERFSILGHFTDEEFHDIENKLEQTFKGKAFLTIENHE